MTAAHRPVWPTPSELFPTSRPGTVKCLCHVPECRHWRSGRHRASRRKSSITINGTSRREVDLFPVGRVAVAGLITTAVALVVVGNSTAGAEPEPAFAGVVQASPLPPSPARCWAFTDAPGGR